MAQAPARTLRLLGDPLVDLCGASEVFQLAECVFDRRRAEQHRQRIASSTLIERMHAKRQLPLRQPERLQRGVAPPLRGQKLALDVRLLGAQRSQSLLRSRELRIERVEAEQRVVAACRDRRGRTLQAVRSTLERHKLQLTVALDRDGVVAARYQATAIPQTVVIDRQGKIVRLFVGGGPRLADQLRNAVRDLLVVEEKPG